MDNSGLVVVLYDASLQKLASSFSSGNSYLDGFLRGSLALDDGFGKTYVLLSSERNAIIGYYNIGVGYIEQIKGDARYKLGGAAHINCFALDEKYQELMQGKTADGVEVKLSDLLLYNYLSRIQEIRANIIGFTFVTLSSTHLGYNLYRRNGFEDLEKDMNYSKEETEEDCIPMYLPLDVE